jgi:hypothetical protein
MQTHQIHVSNGRDKVNGVRRQLFNFPEVLDVFVTSRPDALIVVCSGRPRPGDWLGALRRVGYDVPARRHATATAFEADRADVVEPPDSQARRFYGGSSASSRHRNAPACEAGMVHYA